MTVTTASGRGTVQLDIEADDDPQATLSAVDSASDELARVRVRSYLRLEARSAASRIEEDFRRPG